MHGSKPAISSCGTGTPTVVGNDLSGYITTGGGVVTSCILTFTNTKSDPICLFTAASGASVAFLSAVSTTTVTIGLTVTLPNTKIAYLCWDNS
jgi:hypothetical protein